MMEKILRTFDRIEKDKSVKAVILRVNSPGGTVTASDILYYEIAAFKKRTGIPVVAHFLDVAASGGYYVAMAADRIIATPTTITGSIGVIVSSFNIVALIEKIGVRYNPYKSAEGKDLGSPFKPENEADRKIIQAIVDDMYGRFKGIVATGRGARLKADIATVADGRIVTATEALRVGLIDEIGYMGSAVARAKELAKISDARVVIYTTAEKEPNLGLYSEAGAYRNGQLVDAVLDLLVTGERPGFYYLWK
jgi:protease-4